MPEPADVTQAKEAAQLARAAYMRAIDAERAAVKAWKGGADLVASGGAND